MNIGIWFGEDVETTNVSFSGDIQLEQEGLSGLYDPQVYIFLVNTTNLFWKGSQVFMTHRYKFVLMI